MTLLGIINGPHLLRYLVYLSEASAEQKEWVGAMNELSLEIKESIEEAKAGSHKQPKEEEVKRLSGRYDELVRAGYGVDGPAELSASSTHKT